MKTARSICRLACALVLAVGGGQAFASTSQCDGVGDDTPCSTSCIVDGKCQRGRCSPIALAPDGAPCSSGDRCSHGDYCQGGTCRPGQDKALCPTPDACHVGICDSLVGCSVVDVCQADGGIRAVSQGEVRVDGGSPQAAPPADTGDGGASDGGVRNTDAPPDAADPPEHVRGSGAAGCSMVSGSSPDTLALAAVVISCLAAAGSGRRRARHATEGSESSRPWNTGC